MVVDFVVVVGLNIVAPGLVGLLLRSDLWTLTRDLSCRANYPYSFTTSPPCYFH
jgi:hypothetical protein